MKYYYIVFTIVKYKTRTVVSCTLYIHVIVTYLTIENMLDWFDTGEHIVE